MSSSSSYSTSSPPVTRDDLDTAKAHVHKCEDEIEAIKRALSRFGLGPQDDSSSQPNQLDIAMLKWQGLPDELAPTPAVTLQLSSPVEEIRLDQLWDPLAPKNAAAAAIASDETLSSTTSKSVASFSGVETSMATLTVTVHPTVTTTTSSHNEHHVTDPLGTSESMDVSLWCPLDAMNPQDVYQTEWPVTITRNASSVPTTTIPTTTTSTTSIITEDEKEAAEPTIAVDASEGGGVEETKEETTITEETTAESKTNETAAAAASSSPSSSSTTLGIVTLRVTYRPSAKDQQEALYELLNKASQRKNLALEHLRQVSLQLSRSTDATSTASKKPAVKPGFLNPTKKQQHQPNRFYQWYQATLGPQSMVRIILPVMKNYIIFFAAAVLLHYKGQELALPAPV